MAAPEYATVTQLISLCDARVLAELGSDTDSDGTVNSGNTILVAAIQRASSDIEASALRGGRYTSTDLATAVTDGDMTLVGLTCDLALAQLFGRRAGVLPEDVKDRRDRAMRTLQELREGKIIFAKVASVATAQAGVGDLTVINEAVRGNLNLAADSPFYPQRSYVET